MPCPINIWDLAQDFNEWNISLYLHRLVRPIGKSKPDSLALLSNVHHQVVPVQKAEILGGEARFVANPKFVAFLVAKNLLCRGNTRLLFDFGLDLLCCIFGSDINRYFLSIRQRDIHRHGLCFHLYSVGFRQPELTESALLRQLVAINLQNLLAGSHARFFFDFLFDIFDRICRFELERYLVTIGHVELDLHGFTLHTQYRTLRYTTVHGQFLAFIELFAILE
mmetsp:Transcript_13053/g.28619  ORF Transcript_13053/g.28619 Transcript_13053/m.28619 type:complete len:223 (-) Transcript_13053:2183-2851(-)